MNSPLLAERPLAVLDHHPVGASTGYMSDHRGDWERLAEEASQVSSFAIEFAALDEAELPSLLDFLGSAPPLPFRYLSVHAPVKGRRLAEEDLIDALAQFPSSVDAIVVHPDLMEEPHRYTQLGSRLTIENMDSRKEIGAFGDDLEPLFAALPRAGFCFDIAHAQTVDSSMAAGEDLLGRFASRLRHVHLSSIADGHVPLTEADRHLFAPLLARCRDVPWIFEADPGR